MPTLRSKLIRLAHENPELRPHVLPILVDKEASVTFPPKFKPLMVKALALDIASKPEETGPSMAMKLGLLYAALQPLLITALPEAPIKHRAIGLNRALAVAMSRVGLDEPELSISDGPGSY